MSHRKVFLVGDGRVGSTFANDLLQNVRIDELVISDVVKEISDGDVLDLEDLAPFVGQCNIRSGEYIDARDADVVVITAGAARKPGETRLDLVDKNVRILKSIVPPIVKAGFKGIFVVSANPVDILTTLTQRLSGFPKHKVIGTGTSLDTARLRVALSHKTGINVDQIDAYVLGEHGDTSFENFDEALIANKLLRFYKNLNQETLNEIESSVRKKGAKIIANKGATFYGVAMCLTQIVKAIFENQARVLPLSAPMNGEYGIKDLYLGNPCVINATGIANIIELNLSQKEQEKMQYSAKKMQEVLDKIEL
ncbi:L-lactate dehydrogenase [Lactobacillus sp.]|uniref:L-lactate dehydrogenase n=1 Tax=Lactobacillus sp. TaxID=1591 RepID=UPI0019A1EF5C|nr:L-lactate dehydrogenase [Lactobacillus sp.]MBD5429289.1 L-lactate dehydrogenase [Lactobacillus sp.]